MKVLLIRFSSIGDVTQSLSLPAQIKSHFKSVGATKTSLDDIQIHFLTKQDFSEIIETHPLIDRTWFYNSKMNFFDLVKLGLQLRRENFTHIYDAHNNLRSNFFLTLASFANPAVKILRRKINRWHRFLLLKFKINKFKTPFSGQRDLLEPLAQWGVPVSLPPTPQIFTRRENDDYAEGILRANNYSDFVVLVPSAAYELKRWPATYFQKLTELAPDLKFVVLAGPQDDFAKGLIGSNVLNLTGKTTLGQSLSLIKKAKAVVANDTGLMHFAEQLGRPTLALMGPAPFGFPSRASTHILKRNLSCWPCSKHGQGPCVNQQYHLCLRDILPQEVLQALRRSVGEMTKESLT